MSTTINVQSGLFKCVQIMVPLVESYTFSLGRLGHRAVRVIFYDPLNVHI